MEARPRFALAVVLAVIAVGCAPTPTPPGPTISGVAAVGSTLTVSNGSWSAPPDSFTYRWESCETPDSGCTVVGTDAASYGVSAGDVGRFVRATVTGANAAGRSSATSEPVGPVTGGAGATGGAFHQLDRTRIADGVTVQAGSSVPVTVLGHGGIPTTGVGALWLDLTIANPGGTASSLTVWPTGGARPPTTSASVGASSTAVRLIEVAPGAGGAISLYSDRGPVAVSVDVAGWVAAAPEPGTAGLFTSVPAVDLLDTRDGTGTTAAGVVAPDSTTTVQVTGRGGVPETGVSSVLVNVTAIAPSAATEVTAFAAGAGPPASPDVIVASGAVVSNRAIVPVGADGAIAVHNGAGSTDLVVDVNGWYSDGTGTEGGARLVPIPQSRSVSAATVTTAAPLVVPIAGRAGVPGLDGSIPPTAVVVGVTFSGTTADASLRLAPGSADVPAAVDLAVAPGARGTAVAVVKLGADGSIAVATSASGQISVDVYGYLVGDVVLADHVRVLDPPASAAVTSVTASAVGFSGVPASLSSVAVGDVVTAGASANTPDGLLRKVTGVATPGGNLQLTTAPASVADAIRQGRVHYDSTAPTAAAGGALRSMPSVSAGFSEAWKLSHSWEIPLDGNDRAKVYGTLSGSASMRLSLDAGFTHFDFVTSATVRAHADANLLVDVDASKQECKDFPSVHLATVTVTVGPIPLVFVVDFAPQVCVDGNVKVHMSGGAVADAVATVGVRHIDGETTPIRDAGFTFSALNPATSPTNSGSATLKVSLNTDLTVSVDGVQLLRGGLGFTTEFKLDPCTFSAFLTVDAHAQLHVKIWKWDLAEMAPFKKELARTLLFEIPIASCAYWTGNIHRTRDAGRAAIEGVQLYSSSFTEANVDLVPPSPFVARSLAGSVSYDERGVDDERISLCPGFLTKRLAYERTAPPTPIANVVTGAPGEDVFAKTNWYYSQGTSITFSQAQADGISLRIREAPPMVSRRDNWRMDRGLFSCNDIFESLTTVGTAPVNQFLDDFFSSNYRIILPYTPGQTHLEGSRLYDRIPGSTTATEKYLLTWNLDKHCTIGPPTNC